MPKISAAAPAVLLALLCMAGLLSIEPTVRATADEQEPIGAVVPRVDAIVQHYMQDAHVPGLTYGIIRHGRVEHIGVMGVQDLDARRRL